MPPGTPAAAPAAAPMILNKYKDQPEFEKGMRNLANKAARSEVIKDGEKLIGEGGRWKTLDEAIAAHGAYSAVLHARGGDEETKPEGEVKKPEEKTAEAKPTEPAALRIGEPPAADSEPADIPGILDKAGLKLDDLKAHWQEHGDLSEDHYKAIKGVRKNLGDADVKLIAEGFLAKARLHDAARTQIHGELAGIAGGEQQLKTILGDAAKHIEDPAERAAYNKMLDDPKQAKAALRAIMAIRAEKLGATKSVDTITPTGNTVGATGSPLTNPQDIAAAMRDEKYAPVLSNGMRNPKHDPAYRDGVLRRMQAGAPAR